MRSWWLRVRAGWSSLRLRDFAATPFRCPFCGPSVLVRLNTGEFGVRCARCAASEVHLALGRVLREQVPSLAALDVCELSARGPLAAHLRRHARSLQMSEYFSDVERGAFRDDVRCEDVQRLTYADACFDLITHTEVLEHVPDDRRAFAELYRVLRPGGLMLFSVPLYGGEETVERALLRDGRIEYLHPPVYHADPLRGGAGILAFRDYGRDIVSRLRAAGFADARLYSSRPESAWLHSRQIVFARKERQ